MKNLTGQMARRYAPIVFISVLSVFAWGPLLTPAYFFSAHDAPHSVFFLVEFDQAFKDGYFWPRWSPDFAFGYGYPLFNIYAPLAFFGAEMLHLLGLDFVAAVKAMYILGTLGAGLFMYGFVRHLMNREAGVLAAVVYMFAPFHLVEIFVRCAFPEFIALAILPLVLWAFASLIEKPVLLRIAWAGLAYGVLALTHHSSLFTFTPLLAAFILYLLIVKWRQYDIRAAWKASLAVVKGALLGVALGSIYLIPMLFESSYIKVSQWTAFNYDFRQHFVYFAQLLSPEWGYGYSGPGLHDGMPFQLGVVPLSLAIFAGLLALVCRPQGNDASREKTLADVRRHVFFFLAATVCAIWLLSPAAQFVWLGLPIASLVQFPWRLLGVVALTMSVVAAALYPLGQHVVFKHLETDSIELNAAQHPAWEENTLPVELWVVALVVVLGSFSYTLPQYTQVEAWRQQPQAVVRWDQFSPADRVGMVVYTQEQPTTSPMESQYLSGTPLQVATILNGSGTLETQRHGGASDEIQVYVEESSTIQFYTYDYPGWRVWMDGQPISHRHQAPHGLIVVDVPPGDHHLELRMTPTLPRLLGGAISLAAMVVIAIGLLRKHIWRRQGRLL